MHETSSFTALLIWLALPSYTLAIWILGFGTAKLSKPSSPSYEAKRRDSWDVGHPISKFQQRHRYHSMEEFPQDMGSLGTYDEESGAQEPEPSRTRFTPKATNATPKPRVPSTANVYGASRFPTGQLSTTRSRSPN